MHSSRRFIAPVLALLALAVTFPAQAQNVPSITGALIGPEEKIADYEAPQDRCDPTDTPDQPARAFRDSQNIVHLIISGSNARAMTGPSLDSVTQNCHILHASPEDTSPQDFSNNQWLTSFYTLDGNTIASLVHTEYDGFQIVGACSPRSLQAFYANCWWNTITLAVSNNGGADFSEATPPGNLVASPPYPYDPNNLLGPDGYTGPTGIVKWGNYYYALINDWPFKAQQFGPCLIRTDSLFDPSSWRAWDGAGFTVRFADPYTVQNINPAQHVCAPVYAGDASALVQDQTTGLFIADDFDPGTSYGPAPGLYVWVSRDLIHWSRAYGVGHVTGSEVYATPTTARYSFVYFSLLDPASQDRSFSTVTSTPYIYFVREDANNAPYGRTIFRQQIKLTITPG